MNSTQVTPIATDDVEVEGVIENDPELEAQLDEMLSIGEAAEDSEELPEPLPEPLPDESDTKSESLPEQLPEPLPEQDTEQDDDAAITQDSPFISLDQFEFATHLMVDLSTYADKRKPRDIVDDPLQPSQYCVFTQDSIANTLTSELLGLAKNVSRKRAFVRFGVNDTQHVVGKREDLAAFLVSFVTQQVNALFLEKAKELVNTGVEVSLSGALGTLKKAIQCHVQVTEQDFPDKHAEGCYARSEEDALKVSIFITLTPPKGVLGDVGFLQEHLAHLQNQVDSGVDFELAKSELFNKIQDQNDGFYTVLSGWLSLATNTECSLNLMVDTKSVLPVLMALNQTIADVWYKTATVWETPLPDGVDILDVLFATPEMVALDCVLSHKKCVANGKALSFPITLNDDKSVFGVHSTAP